MAANPRLCIFDLDGTLVDSLRDIGESLNVCLELLGLTPYPIEDYKYMVGEGVPKLAERAIGGTAPHLVPRLAELARAVYRTRVLRYTRPYAGVPELLDALKGQDVRLAVLSNKPHDLTTSIIRTLWPNGIFDRVYGYTIEEHRKPSPYYVTRIATELDIPPQQTWMIGDTGVDIAAAHAAGAVGVGVTWGFRPRGELEAAGADHIVDQPEQLLRDVRKEV